MNTLLMATMTSIPLLLGCERGSPANLGRGRASERALDPTRFCVTLGELTSRREVGSAKFRATFPGISGDFAALGFRYAGPTRAVERLGSGLERRQLGLKLRARDACNLVYVMWRTEPKAEVVVSLKSNPGARTSRECENAGYTNLRPGLHRAPPALEPGSRHELRAQIAGDTLSAAIDDVKVWEGTLPEAARALRGSPGVRSDNVAWTLVAFHTRDDSSGGAAPLPELTCNE